MTGPLLFLVGYAVVVGAAAAIAWGVLRGAGRLDARPAAWWAVGAWVAAMAFPVAGLIADEARQPVTCGPGEECPDYILWFLGIPAGWLAAVVLVALVSLAGRHVARRHRRRADAPGGAPRDRLRT